MISRRLTLIFIAATALALTLAGTAAAAPEASKSAGIASEQLERSPADVRAYWTPSRMRAAEGVEPPIEFDLEDGGSDGAGYAAQPPDVEEPAGFELLYPDRVHGKLFVTIAGQNGSCSATIVTSLTRDLIMTAGHCVSLTAPEAGGTPQFATNVLFVPGYRDGATPFGTFAATRLAAPQIWLREADPTFDVGVANLAPSALGPIQSLLGSRGVTFNRRLKKYNGNVFQLFGYPGQPAPFYDGQKLIRCDATFRGPDVVAGGIAVSPCHMQEGSSGGGWVRNGLVNSVVSHGGCFIPSTACDVIAGPYFEDAAFELYQATSGGISKGKRKRIKRCRKFDKRSKRLNCLNNAETFQPSG